MMIYMPMLVTWKDIVEAVDLSDWINEWTASLDGTDDEFTDAELLEYERGAFPENDLALWKILFPMGW